MNSSTNNLNDFKFFKNYFSLIKELPKKNRLELYDSILNYMFEDKEPQLKGLSKGVWDNISMPLKKTKTKALAGKKGGLNRSENNSNKSESKTLSKTTSKTKAKQQANDKRKNNISSFFFLLSNISIFNKDNNIINLFKEYLELRIKNKYTLSETIVKRLINKLNEYGKTDSEKEEIISNAINGAWKDFYPLEKRETIKNSYKTSGDRLRELEEKIIREEEENEKARSI